MSTRHNALVAHSNDRRVIVHFDYDCFYAAVFEAENPALKSLPLAVQQKHIIVTCNYEARRRGLFKLQLITEAKRICPDLIIVLGEDISRFRDASKDLYNFLAPFSWSRKVERLGFDEVWFDVTDVVDYNLALLNKMSLDQSFFHLSKEDPTIGFSFDGSRFCGHTYPPDADSVQCADREEEELTLRLRLGSHLAMHMRRELEDSKHYTATVGIATNKLLSKLVGNLNKPNGQTTLLPPYGASRVHEGNAISFLDSHDIGKVPNIGFKMAQKLRSHVLNRDPVFDKGLIYGGTLESVSVRDVRLHPDIDPEKLEKILAGPGAPHGIGTKTWQLLHGVDMTEVARARAVPRQISIEDSYLRLDTMPEVLRELETLARSLLNRMRIDLVTDEPEDEEDDDGDKDEPSLDNSHLASEVAEPKDEATVHQRPKPPKRWLAHPKTLRLTTRPRMPQRADGTRARSFKRQSHSAPLPHFVFNLHEDVRAQAGRLVREALVPLFRRLHPERSRGWNLSLVNVAVTNLVEAAGEGADASGRDIGRMFRRQEDVLRDFRVVDDGPDSMGETDGGREDEGGITMEEEEQPAVEEDGEATWEDEDVRMVEDDSKQILQRYRDKGKGRAKEPDAPLWKESDLAARPNRFDESGDNNDDFYDDEYDVDDDDDEDDVAIDAVEQAMGGQPCSICGATLPSFALPAHERFHALGD